MIDKKLNRIIVYLLYLLAFTSALYMFEAVQSIIMIAVSLFLLLHCRNDRKKLFSIKTIPFLLSFVVLMLFNLFYFDSKSLQNIANSLLLFIVPLFSICLYQSDFFKKHKEKIILIYCICISLISIYIIVYYINDIPNHRFNWYYARFNLENTIHIHGTYISLWTGVAILFIFDLLAKNQEKTFKFKAILIFVSLVLLTSLIIINARMSLYAVLFLISLNSYFYFYKKRQVNLKLIIIPLILLFSGVIFLSQRYQDDIQFLNKNTIANSSRYTICYCSLKVIKDSHFLGTNNGSIQSKLNSCYNGYGFEDLSKDNLNSHNQYLDYFMKGGFLLFLAFSASLFIKLKTALKDKNYLYFSITLLFSFAFLTENVLVRQYGIYIFIFCDILFLGSILTYKSHGTDKIEKSQSGN
ncbi:O-antigen ligase family protein [Flavobacterium foetidum]|uniref:O-antigen ligase family protein n=1 Tax=Flavobacterium foetidum TaxID=2026681 RepID=UPI00107586D0|nr:O-antigen ligase family protein [Flavobacterium foetidum]KAF2511336.1 O-antigen ligase family protein [Flavobacterium foetidum]